MSETEYTYIEFLEPYPSKSSASLKEKILTRFFQTIFFLFYVNHKLDDVRHNVYKWQLELSNELTDKPEINREVALNEEGVPIWAAPSLKNYGYWFDSGITDLDGYTQFSPVMIQRKDFDQSWKQYFKENRNDRPENDFIPA